MKRLIVSLHDVAPVHMHRLRRAESMFRRLGVEQVQYLFVPEFHGRYRASEYPDFLMWCRRERSFQISWWLHGYYHQDRQPDATPETLSLIQTLKRRFMTAGEGEFLPIDAATQRQRLKNALEEFSHCFHGVKPKGFVPPAWLFKPEVLLPLLKEFDLAFTEDHHRIHDIHRGTSLSAPVVTWATRTLMRSPLSAASAMSAIWACTVCISQSGAPKSLRLRVCDSVSSSARRAKLAVATCRT